MMSSQSTQPNNSQKSKAGRPKTSAKGKHNKSSHALVQYLCKTCNDKVKDEDRSMICDFCHHYTHVSCDDKLTDELCDCLDENEGNSMVYLCVDCKPMLIPKTSEHLFDGITKKVEKVLEDPNRKNLAETIMNKLSSQIRELDQMVIDHKAGMTQTQNEFKQILVDVIQESDKVNTGVSSYVKELTQMLNEQRGSICQTETDIKKVIEEMREYHHSDMSNQQHRHDPHENFDIEYPKPNHHPPPFGSPMDSAWLRPPNMSRSVPTPHMAPNGPYRGPPLTSAQNDRNTKWQYNPETSLVVYNLSNNVSVTNNIEQLSLRCSLYPYEIEHAERRHSYSDRNAPLFIQCVNKNVKWKMIVQVNKLRAEEEYKKTYARPFLTEEDLKQDRALVRKLTHYRSKYTERSFKIRRGVIYEIINDRETPFNEEEGRTSHEENTDNSNAHSDQHLRWKHKNQQEQEIQHRHTRDCRQRESLMMHRHNRDSRQRESLMMH